MQALRLAVAAALVAALVDVPSYAQPAQPTPLGLSCTPTDGVRFCPGNGTTDRIPSFDGVLLDADVTLPPAGNGPWPTIVLLHGLGGDKSQLQPNAPQQSGLAPRVLPNTTRYSNLWYASRGYATLSYTTRGFGESCGGGGMPGALLQTPPCDIGFIRIADTRYEARDTQYLLGLLADEGIAIPDKLGATGFSYGGGLAVELGYLNDRIRCPGFSTGPDDPCADADDGDVVPWTSPAGMPLSMGAVYGQWLWSDLIASLLPNGRFLDDDLSTLDSSLEPLGVMAQSYVHALFGLAASEGYIVAPQPPGGPFEEWDLTTAIALLDAGEPYGPQVEFIAEQYHRFHGGFGIPGEPAPMLLESGWNDDLFPPAESIRVYNDVRARHPDVPVAMLLGDLGHARDANKPTVSLAFNELASAFFDEHLRGVGTGPTPASVTAYISTCPARGSNAPADGGPFAAASWEELRDGAVVIAGAAPQTVSALGGDPTVGMQFDPIPQINPFGTDDPCTTIPATASPGTAVYELESEGFTMLGLPTIEATVTTTGANGQLVGRLWDVSPDGQQLLVTRAVYRLTDDQTGPIRFQLHGNGWEFAAGHIVKLELAAHDAPQYRASNGIFDVEVRDLVLTLPLLAAQDGRPASGADDEELRPTPVTGGGSLLAAIGLAVLALWALQSARCRRGRPRNSLG